MAAHGPGRLAGAQLALSVAAQDGGGRGRMEALVTVRRLAAVCTMVRALAAARPRTAAPEGLPALCPALSGGEDAPCEQHKWLRPVGQEAPPAAPAV